MKCHAFQPLLLQAPLPRRQVVDTPGASADGRRDSDVYSDRDHIGDGDDMDEYETGSEVAEDGEEGEEEEGEGDADEEEEEEGAYDPLARRMAKGLARAHQRVRRRGGADPLAGADDDEEDEGEDLEGAEFEGSEEGEEEDDDVCGVCGEPGELMLCESCDCCVHARCVGLRSIPEGDWFCEMCRPAGRQRRQQL